MAALMSPFPNTSVVPPGWQARHRATAEQTMTVGITATRAGTGEGTYNEGTGQTTPAAATDVASCPARIQARDASERVAVVGDQVRTLRSYLVTVPVGAGDFQVDDRLEVTSVADDDDPELLGLALRVRDVMYGSLVWERDLIAEDDLG